MLYYLGRLNLYGSLPDKAANLFQSLSSRSKITRYRNNWVVVDATRRQISGREDQVIELLTGRLVRYRDEPEEVFDEEIGQIRTVVVEKEVFGDG